MAWASNKLMDYCTSKLTIFKELILFKDLKTRFLVALTLIALLSIVGFGLAAYMSERGALTENLRADLTSTADFKKAQIVDWLNESSADVRMVAINKSNRDNLAKLMGLENYLPLNHAQKKAVLPDPRAMTMMTAMLTNNLISLQQSRIGYTRIVMADQAGRVQITTDATLRGQSIADSAAFQGTMKASKGTYTYDIHRDPEGSGEQYWLELGHIINPDLSTDHPDPANTIGVVLITINLNEAFFPLLRSWQAGSTGTFILHSAQTGATFAIDKQRIRPVDSSIFATNKFTSAQFTDDQYEATLETVDDQGTPILATYRHIVENNGPSLDWKFIVKKDVREIYAPLYSLLAHIAWIAMALLCIAVLASVLIARTLSQPLAELVVATQSVALGNLKTEIDFARNDEIGQLATAFQEMIRALDQHQRELEDANVAVRNVARENAQLVLQLEALNADLEAKIKQRTRDLDQANQRLQKLDDMKSAFLLNVSHELRNPVTSLKFNLDLLQRELIRTNSQSLKSERYMTTLTKHLDLLTHIIEDMLNLLHLEREKDDVAFHSIDLNKVVEATLADYQTQIDAAALKLIYAPASNLPSVKAEPTWLAQMLTYLLNNAILYNTPAGHIRISTYFNGRGQVGFQVEDTGIGISAEEVGHIFDRFYRGAVVNESAIPGTGLGLSIVKKIVHLHQGQIEVESQLNQGSTFRIWLPIDKFERRAERSLPEHILANSGITNDAYCFQKMTERESTGSGTGYCP